MNPHRILSPLAALLVLTSATRPARSEPAAPTAAAPQIKAAAEAFLGSLTAEQRGKAVFPADDPERKNWSNLPHTLYARKGISLGEMTPDQRVKAHQLLQAGLSSQGYLKASGIMQLDEVLLHLSGQDKSDKPMFGLKHYWLSFLGEPGSGKPWGWQLDGHHLALNFSVVGKGVAITPQFMGSDPHEVRDGLHAGWRVLGAEDDKGLALMRSLDPAQQAKALVMKEAPADVIAGAGKDKEIPEQAGLPYASLSKEQRSLLRAVVEEYVHNYRHDLAHQYMDEIDVSGWDKLTFAWAGPVGSTAPYYYRVQGPTILIEFDNNYAPGRKGGPVNHIHSVFRDPRNDYGEDLLKRHLKESHGR